MNNIYDLVDQCWTLYVKKVAGGVLPFANERTMQLRPSQMLQSMADLHTLRSTESIEVLLEHPVLIGSKQKFIDIVIRHRDGRKRAHYPVELKCFREFVAETKCRNVRPCWTLRVL